MPGIAGIVSFQGHDTIQVVLTRMGAALPSQEDCSPQIWAGARAGVATSRSRIVEMITSEQTDSGGSQVTLGVIGQIAGDEIFRKRFAQALFGQAQPSLAGCLLAMFKQFGPAGLQGLNGAYVAVVWEELPGRLTLVSDRGGMQPFYYSLQGRDLLFSSHQRAISSAPNFNRQVNPTAVFDLLAAEQMLDERTLFAYIQSLPPAALLTFERGNLRVQSYWKPKLYAPGDPMPSEAEAIEGLAEHINAGVKLNLDEAAAITADNYLSQAGVCLLLTGGLDSRLLAGSLARLKGDIPITANSIGHEQARDVLYGREIARATGLAYTVLPANPCYLAEYAAEFVHRTEGGSNVHASWILGEIGYLSQAHIPAIFTGVGAEAVSGRHWLSDQPVLTRAEALDRLCEARWTYSQAATLLRPELCEEAVQASRESLRRTLAEASSDHLLGWSDYFAYRQNRRHPTGNVLSEDVLVLEPFFENRLVDYAYGLPPELRNKGMLYKKMIIQRFPEVAGIGYTDSGMLLKNELTVGSSISSLAAMGRDFSRWVSNRLKRKMLFLWRGPFGDKPAQAIYYNHWLRTDARPFVFSVLNREELYSDFLEVSRVRRIVDEHMAGQRDEFRLINAVVTFALWRELFDRA